MYRALLLTLLLVSTASAVARGSRSSSSRSRSSSTRRLTDGCRSTSVRASCTRRYGTVGVITSDSSCYADTIVAHATNGKVKLAGIELDSTTDAVLSQGTTIQLICDEGYSRGYGVLSSFSCNHYEEYQCYPDCVILAEDTSANLVIDAGRTRVLTNGTALNKGESLTATCAAGNSFENTLDVEKKLVCGSAGSMLTVPVCRPTPKCKILADDENTKLTVLRAVEGDRVVTNGDTVDDGREVVAKCKDLTGSSFVNSTTNLMNATCDTGMGKESGVVIGFPACRPKCNVTALIKTMTEGTLFDRDGAAGVNQSVSITGCKDELWDINNSVEEGNARATYYSFVRDSDSRARRTVCTYDAVNGTSYFTPSTIPLLEQCWAQPKVTVTAIGDKTVRISATVDAVNSQLVLKEVSVYESTEGFFLLLNKHDAPDGDLMKNLSGYEYSNEAFEYGYYVAVVVSLKYEGYVDSELVGGAGTYMAPPAVNVTTTIIDYKYYNQEQTPFVDVTVKMSERESDGSYFPGPTSLNNINDLELFYGSLMLKFELVSFTGETVYTQTLKANDKTDYKDGEDDQYTSYRIYKLTIPEPESIVKKGDKCMMRITSVNGEGPLGGSVELQAKMGKKTVSAAEGRVLSLTVIMACLIVFLFAE